MISKKEFFKKFSVFAIIVTLLFIAAGFVSYRKTVKEYRDNIRNLQRVEAVAVGNVIRNFIALKQADIDFFVRQKEIRTFIQDQSQANIEALRQSVADIMARLKYYFQFRVLDINGHEIFKMNYKNGRLVFIPKENYQDKSNRYYFKEAKKLTFGQVYVSNFDYNVEYGELERPVVPTLRLVAPVYVNKVKKAYVVVNYNRNMLANSFESLAKTSFFNLYVVNNQKQYLYYLFNQDNLDQFLENPQQDSGLMNLIFSSPDFFVKKYTYFYKLRIPLGSKLQQTESAAYFYVVLELPKQVYTEHMLAKLKTTVIKFFVLYLIVLAALFASLIYLRIGYRPSQPEL